MEDMCAVSRQLVDNQVMLSAPAATKDAYFSTMHANAMLTAENRRKRLDLEEQEVEARLEEVALKKQKLHLDKLELDQRRSQQPKKTNEVFLNNPISNAKSAYEKDSVERSKAKDAALNTKVALKGNDVLPRDWKKFLPDHIEMWTNMQSLSNELGSRQCCGGKECGMTKNDMTPGPQHFCVGCGRNICIGCIEGRMDGAQLDGPYRWYYCNLYESVSNALACSINSCNDLINN